MSTITRVRAPLRRAAPGLSRAAASARSALRAPIGNIPASITIGAVLAIAAVWSLPLDESPLQLDVSPAGPAQGPVAVTHTPEPEVEFTPDGLLAGVVLLGDGPAIPVLGVRPSDLRDTYGQPRTGERRHAGIDIGAPLRTPLAAAMDGWIVAMSWNEFGGRGLHIVDRTGTWLLYYAHLDGYAAGLYNGMAVRRGELLGYVGTTGNARGWPHLHFETGRLTTQGSLSARPVNPYDFLLNRIPTGQ